MDLLGCLSDQVAYLQSGIAVISEQQSYVLHDETSHFHFLALFYVGGIFDHFLYLLAQFGHKLKYPFELVVVEIDLKGGLVVQIYSMQMMSYLPIFKGQQFFDVDSVGPFGEFLLNQAEKVLF